MLWSDDETRASWWLMAALVVLAILAWPTQIWRRVARSIRSYRRWRNAGTHISLD